MVHTRPEEKLLEALKAFPPSTVYADTEKKTVFKAFQLYSNGRVVSIRWKGSVGTLIVAVDDKKIHEVSMDLHASHLRFSCSCGNDNSQGKCEHLICALLATIHALKPNIFKLAREPETYKKMFLAGLLKKYRTDNQSEDVQSVNKGGRNTGNSLLNMQTGSETGFCVVVEKGMSGLKVSIEHGRERIVPSRGRDRLPPGLEYLMNSSRQEDIVTALLIFLKAWGNRYSLYYRSEGNIREIFWAPDVPCETFTELDASVDDIYVHKRCFIGTDRAPADIIGKFAVDREQSRFCYIRDRDGWATWDKLYGMLVSRHSEYGRLPESYETSFSVTPDAFKKTGITFNASSPDEDGISSLILKKNGMREKAREINAFDYRIILKRRAPGAAEYIVSYECSTGDYLLHSSKRIMAFPKAVEWGRVPASVRTRKRKPLMYESFFSALKLDNRKDVDETLRTVINDRTFDAPQHAILARRIVREFLSEVRTNEVALHYIDGRWCSLTYDIAKEATIFTILYGIFGPRLFERVVNNIEMVVREEALLRHINTLYTQARKEKISVSLDGRPVEEATWEFAVDATDGTIDWFEIRPEIRCNGQVISRELWEQALAGKGMIHADGSVRILDEKAFRMLSAIARFPDASKGTKTREIVVVPRLRIIDLFMLRQEGVKVKLASADEEVINRLTRFKQIESTPIPSGLNAELRSYQKDGYYWLCFLYEHGFGACLADDMGLGKTIQAICLLGALKEGKITRPGATTGLSLIVVPPSLIFNWEQELSRFYPGLRVSVYRGRERTIKRDEYDVVLTSYGLILRDIEKLRKVDFHTIIFDEAQAVKNVFAGCTGAVRQLRGLFKVALTGTPVENHIGEYYSILDLVLPGLLGNYRDFKGKAKEDLAAFVPDVTERTKPFVLRRTKEHILKELPPKIEHDVYLELTDKQKIFYNRTVEEVRDTIDAAFRSKADSQAKIIALTAIMRLRQICLTPELLTPLFKEMSPKIEYLIGKLEELQEESHSALVFSQFTSFLDVVEKALGSKGFLIYRLDGAVPVAKRKSIVEGFQKSEKPAVFLLSLKAGGQGLNLTRATYVFHLDPWWNPAVENQASDRSHRIGQKNKVIVTRLIMGHTVEEKMMALKQRKMSLYRALMENPEKSAGASVTRADFNFLLGRGG